MGSRNLTDAAPSLRRGGSDSITPERQGFAQSGLPILNANYASQRIALVRSCPSIGRCPRPKREFLSHVEARRDEEQGRLEFHLVAERPLWALRRETPFQMTVLIPSARALAEVILQLERHPCVALNLSRGAHDQLRFEPAAVVDVGPSGDPLHQTFEAHCRQPLRVLRHSR